MLSPSAPSRTSSSSRNPLGYLPALDGLRALAVAAVVAYHLGYSRVPGGYIGVEVFFVLSGWLVCALLVAEHRARDGIDLVAFWRRRARRLLPAVSLVVGTTLVVALQARYHHFATLRGDGLAALGYVLNWRLIVDQKSYFAAAAAGPSPLRHLWSLSIEEQFYLALPLLLGLTLAGRRTGPRAALLALGAAVVATGWRLVVDAPGGGDPSRLYYGTDTRAAGLLVGAALALVWVPGRLRPVPGRWAGPVLDVVALASLAVLGWYTFEVGERDPDAFGWSLTVVQIASVTLIAVVVHPVRGLVARLLALRPLRWTGQRSYGIYLWHWPLIVLLAKAPGEQPSSPSRSVTIVAATLAVAAVSYRLVEQPIRQHGVADAFSLARRWTARRIAGRPVLTGAVTALAIVGYVGSVLLARDIVAADDTPTDPPPTALATPRGPNATPTPNSLPHPCPTPAPGPLTTPDSPVTTSPTTGSPARTEAEPGADTASPAGTEAEAGAGERAEGDSQAKAGARTRTGAQAMTGTRASGRTGPETESSTGTSGRPGTGDVTDADSTGTEAETSTTTGSQTSTATEAGSGSSSDDRTETGTGSRTGTGTSTGSRTGTSTSTGSRTGTGTEAQSSTRAGIEAEASTDTGDRNGTGASTGAKAETGSRSGTRIRAQGNTGAGSGTNTENSTGTGTDSRTGRRSGSGAEAESSAGSGGRDGTGAEGQGGVGAGDGTGAGAEREPQGCPPGAGGVGTIETESTGDGAAPPAATGGAWGAVAALPWTTAVGDSVMLGAAPALEARFGPQLVIEARVGFQMADAPELVQRLAAEGRLGDVVILHLGANGPFPDSTIDEIMGIVGRRPVLLVNVKVPRRWESEVNDRIAAAAERYPSVEVVDWRTVSESEDGLLWSDGHHLTPAGAERYADLITSSTAAVSLSGDERASSDHR